MDDNTKLLEQIRDLLQRQHDFAVKRDAELKAYTDEALQLTRSHGRFYKRVVGAGAVVVVVLLIFLFSAVSRG